MLNFQRLPVVFSFAALDEIGRVISLNAYCVRCGDYVRIVDNAERAFGLRRAWLNDHFVDNGKCKNENTNQI